LIFAIRFYRGYARKIKAAGRRNSLRLADILARVWTDCLEETIWGLESLEKDIRERLNALSSLWGKDKTT
ncbi:MAG TPA: hypothetical protein HPP90_00925, partial [Deltaproteobacteria bacterium]|nr:hypothetical protein [Deltaproteobacteria bacterium]